MLERAFSGNRGGQVDKRINCLDACDLHFPSTPVHRDAGADGEDRSACSAAACGTSGWRFFHAEATIAGVLAECGPCDIVLHVGSHAGRRVRASSTSSLLAGKRCSGSSYTNVTHSTGAA